VSGFIRVKPADKGQPQHEFDIAVVRYEADPKKYTVVDREPVAEPRQVKYVQASPVAKKSGGSTEKGRA
jgi:hypothetical protein